MCHSNSTIFLSKSIVPVKESAQIFRGLLCSLFKNYFVFGLWTLLYYTWRCMLSFCSGIIPGITQSEIQCRKANLLLPHAKHALSRSVLWTSISLALEHHYSYQGAELELFIISSVLYGHWQLSILNWHWQYGNEAFLVMGFRKWVIWR